LIPGTEFDLSQWILPLAILLLSGLLLSIFLIVWIILRVRKIQLPDGAGLVVALRATPLSVVILLDLLDFSLDFLAAPIAWPLLGYLGLSPLRGVTVLEGLIPGTQLLPTMTLAWLFVRLFR
jgi:hypothetical protein